MERFQAIDFALSVNSKNSMRKKVSEKITRIESWVVEISSFEVAYFALIFCTRVLSNYDVM